MSLLLHPLQTLLLLRLQQAASNPAPQQPQAEQLTNQIPAQAPGLSQPQAVGGAFQQPIFAPGQVPLAPLPSQPVSSLALYRPPSQYLQPQTFAQPGGQVSPRTVCLPPHPLSLSLFALAIV